MYHLAQINVAHIRGGADDPMMAGFFDNLDRINQLAEKSPGFVWRFQSEQGNATDIILTDDPNFLVNISLWESVEALKAYTYRTEHQAFVKRRKEWFNRYEGAYYALWWVPAGHIPTPEEALARLAQLDKEGPSREVFNFTAAFPPPG